jgi:flagellar protein FlbD
MIYLTRLNHTSLVLNCDLIEHIEMTPDTVVTLTTGPKLVVLETADDIIERVRDYRRSLLTPRWTSSSAASLNENQQSTSGGDSNGISGT